MSLKSFQLQGYVDSEKEYKALEKLILAQYKEAEALIDRRLADLFVQMGSVKPEDQYNWLIQYDRNIKLKRDITAIYTKYDVKAMGLTAESGNIAISNNYYRQFYALEWQAPMVTFSVLPDDLMKYAVTGQAKAWSKLTKIQKEKYLNSSIWPPSGTLTELFSKNRKDAILAIQRQINAGMIAGDSYKQISRRVSSVIGEVSKGQATGQLAKSLRIVRTEGNRLLNEGAYASSLEAEQQGIDIMREWDAALDSGTRPEHAAADGQRVEVDKPFTVMGEKLMFPGDSAGSSKNIINCRCTTTDIVEGFEPDIRRGRTPLTGENEVFSYKDFPEWSKEHGLTKNKYGRMYEQEG